MLLERFPDLPQMSVLDLGGTAGFWDHLRVRPGALTVLNIEHPPSDWADIVVGDACDPPASVTSRSFDLVFSNSVIDQVGGHARRAEFADVARTLAPHHWVQSAYRYFPIDAYFLFPGFAQLPVAARAAILRRWKLTHQHVEDPREALGRALRIELLSRAELHYLFPESEVLYERFAGVPKAIVATG